MIRARLHIESRRQAHLGYVAFERWPGRLWIRRPRDISLHSRDRRRIVRGEFRSEFPIDAVDFAPGMPVLRYLDREELQQVRMEVRSIQGVMRSRHITFRQAVPPLPHYNGE